MVASLYFELKAYEEPNPCRLAAILRDLMPEPALGISRGKLKIVWAKRYPKHTAQKGEKTVARRLHEATTRLRAANVIADSGTLIVVKNLENLYLSADNLAIVQGRNGRGVPQRNWSRLPTVPDHLLSMQRMVHGRHGD